MAGIVLFHGALGLRPALLKWAERLRDDGHEVHTPGLFEGQVFDVLEAGVAASEAIGIEELTQRARAAVADLPPDLFYIGFSGGTAPSMMFAATRPGARGAVLVHGFAPLQALGISLWPETVPVQIHFAKQDPWVDVSACSDLISNIPLLEIYKYRGSAHFFTDPDLDEYDEPPAKAVFERLRKFVAE